MEREMTDDLKPCPFCGGKAIACGDNEFNPRHWVMCSNCHACPGGDVAARHEAIAAWNHRAKPSSGLEPIAWLRHGENAPVQNVPLGAMWITEKDDPLGFAVYDATPYGLDTAVAIIEARLPLYTDIGQINALRECISSIKGAIKDNGR
jgi:hypothetical protein